MHPIFTNKDYVNMATDTYNIFETIVDNCMNNTTHTDKLTVQH